MNKAGEWGENKVCEYLRRKGYTILHRNFRGLLEGKIIGEIDIIALEQEMILVVEVKMRSYGDCGTAAEAVDFRKQKRICYTFNYYRMQRRLAENTAVRFDVIEVDKDFRCHWIQNAFEFQG